MTDIKEFADRYVAVWNEPDPGVRRKTVTELWAPDAVETTDAHRHAGHDALVERVTSAYDRLVGGGEYRFVPAGDEVGHFDVVKFTTHMIGTADGEVAWRGLIIAILGADGRIRLDYQFAV